MFELISDDLISRDSNHVHTVFPFKDPKSSKLIYTYLDDYVQDRYSREYALFCSHQRYAEQHLTFGKLEYKNYLISTTVTFNKYPKVVIFFPGYRDIQKLKRSLERMIYNIWTNITTGKCADLPIGIPRLFTNPEKWKKIYDYLHIMSDDYKIRIRAFDNNPIQKLNLILEKGIFTDPNGEIDYDILD